MYLTGSKAVLYPLLFLLNVVIIRHFNTVDTFEMVESGHHALDGFMIRWSPGIRNEISQKKFHGRVQVFADLIMIQWSPGISTIEGKFCVRTAVPNV